MIQSVAYKHDVYGQAYGVVGESCPNLKRFRLSKHCFFNISKVVVLTRMKKSGGSQRCICSLQLFCPYLASSHFTFVTASMLAAAVRSECGSIKALKLPHDSTAGYTSKFCILMLRLLS
jgi:hypothetical protein